MRKGEATRLRIIESALDAFVAVGFTETTFGKLSEMSGLTQPGIYAYFSDRGELLAACALHAAEKGREFIDQAIRPQVYASDALKTYIEMNFRWTIERRRDAYAILAMYYFGATHPAIQALHFQLDAIGIERINGYLLQGIREKLWHLGDPKETAQRIHSLLVGELIKAFHWPKDASATSRSRMVWEFVETNLKKTRPSPESRARGK